MFCSLDVCWWTVWQRQAGIWHQIASGDGAMTRYRRDDRPPTLWHRPTQLASSRQRLDRIYTSIGYSSTRQRFGLCLLTCFLCRINLFIRHFGAVSSPRLLSPASMTSLWRHTSRALKSVDVACGVCATGSGSRSLSIHIIEIIIVGFSNSLSYLW